MRPVLAMAAWVLALGCAGPPPEEPACRVFSLGGALAFSGPGSHRVPIRITGQCQLDVQTRLLDLAGREHPSRFGGSSHYGAEVYATLPGPGHYDLFVRYEPNHGGAQFQLLATHPHDGGEPLRRNLPRAYRHLDLSFEWNGLGLGDDRTLDVLVDGGVVSTVAARDFERQGSTVWVSESTRVRRYAWDGGALDATGAQTFGCLNASRVIAVSERRAWAQCDQALVLLELTDGGPRETEALNGLAPPGDWRGVETDAGFLLCEPSRVCLVSAEKRPPVCSPAGGGIGKPFAVDSSGIWYAGPLGAAGISLCRLGADGRPNLQNISRLDFAPSPVDHGGPVGNLGSIPLAVELRLEHNALAAQDFPTLPKLKESGPRWVRAEGDAGEQFLYPR